MSDLSRYVVRGTDQPAEVFGWGQICWLDSAAVTGTERLTFGRVTINPGQANPEHLHPNCDEVLYVIEGELEHTIGEAVYQLATGDLIHIPAGQLHQGRNTSERPCTVVVAYDTGRREVVGNFAPDQES